MERDVENLDGAQTDTKAAGEGAAPSSGDAKSLFTALRDALIVLGLFLYLLGFLYYVTFLSQFGIAVNFQDFPLYQLFVYAYAVMVPSWTVFAAIGATILIVAFVFPRYFDTMLDRRSRQRTHEVNSLALAKHEVDRLRMRSEEIESRMRRWMSLMMPFMYLYVAVFGVYFGFSRTHSEAVADAQAFLLIGKLRDTSIGVVPSAGATHFLLSDELKTTIDQRFFAADKEGRLRILLESKDRYGILVTGDPKSASSLPRGRIFSVKREDIRLYTAGATRTP